MKALPSTYRVTCSVVLRVKERGLLGALGRQLWIIIRHPIAQQGLCHAQGEKHRHAPAPQGDAHIDETEDEPLRHPAVEPAC